MTATRCRGCAGENLTKVLDLGLVPGSDHFPPAEDPAPDECWPLELWLCGTCALVQLGPVAARLPEPPLAVESATSKAHAARSVADMGRLLDLDGRTVSEFASHHGGSWMDRLRAAGSRPADDDEPADLVVDVHALAHEEDVAGALAARTARLAADGLLVLEFHHLLPLVRGSQFDTVRHGHWSYLSLHAVQNLAARHGLRVVGARPEPVFGGSLRVLLVHQTAEGVADDSVTSVLAEEEAEGLATAPGLARLQAAAAHGADALHAYLEKLRADGRTVLGYGAPSKAAVLLGVAGVGPDLLPFTVDAAPGKHGRRIPGCRVPVRPVEQLRAAAPDVVLVLTWDIVDEVVGQLGATGGWGAEYVVPLPEPHRWRRRNV